MWSRKLAHEKYNEFAFSIRSDTKTMNSFHHVLKYDFSYQSILILGKQEMKMKLLPY